MSPLFFNTTSEVAGQLGATDSAAQDSCAPRMHRWHLRPHPRLLVLPSTRRPRAKGRSLVFPPAPAGRVEEHFVAVSALVSEPGTEAGAHPWLRG